MADHGHPFELNTRMIQGAKLNERFLELRWSIPSCPCSSNYFACLVKQAGGQSDWLTSIDPNVGW